MKKISKSDIFWGLFPVVASMIGILAVSAVLVVAKLAA